MTVSQLPAQEAELITLWVSQHAPALVAALANVRVILAPAASSRDSSAP